MGARSDDAFDACVPGRQGSASHACWRTRVPAPVQSARSNMVFGTGMEEFRLSQCAADRTLGTLRARIQRAIIIGAEHQSQVPGWTVECELRRLSLQPELRRKW